jgi:hypothetical protein
VATNPDVDDAVVCRVCAAPAERFRPYRGIPRSEPLLVAAFRDRSAFHCRTCGHVFCEPMPEEELLVRYYGGAYAAEAAPTLRARVAASRIGQLVLDLRARLGLERLGAGREQLRAVLAVVDRDVRPRWLDGARMLEIGAGSAAFSRAVRARWGAHVACAVAEPDARHSVYRRHGLRVVAATLAGVDDDARYRLVAASHVVEHFADVRAAFAKVARLCESGGLFFVEVPCCAPPYWDVYRFPDPPHLHFFTPRSLRTLAETSGFVVRSLEDAGAPLADDPGFLLPTTGELVDDAELEALLARRAAKLGRRARGRDRGRGTRDVLRLVAQAMRPPAAPSR